MEKTLLSEIHRFSSFISRGNILDLAIGTVIGGAFTGIVSSFTKDILSPFLDIVTSHTMEDSFFILKPGPRAPYKKFQDAKSDGAVVIVWGTFVQASINFVTQALCLFLFIRLIETMKKIGVVASRTVAR